MRRVTRVAVGLALAGLAVVAGVLLVAGYQKNSQIDNLRAHGVPVELTVTHCLGLMGGSGSNLAGYDCSGTYTVGGHVFTEDIPGNTLAPARYDRAWCDRAGGSRTVLDARNRGLRACLVDRLPRPRCPARRARRACSHWSASGRATGHSRDRPRDSVGLPVTPGGVGTSGSDSGSSEVALPMAARDPDKPTLSERFTRAMIKAETAERPAKEPGPTTVDELEEAVKRANDNERLIGLLAAPLAGMVGLLVTGSLLANDPKSYSSVYPSSPSPSWSWPWRCWRRPGSASGSTSGSRWPSTGSPSSIFTSGDSGSRSSCSAPGTWSAHTGCSRS